MTTHVSRLTKRASRVSAKSFAYAQARTHYSLLTTHDRNMTPFPRRTASSSLALLCILLLATCSVRDNAVRQDIAVRWELVTNLTETPDVFEARFTLVNNSAKELTDKNWALFFNMAPRPILENKTTEPALVKHISGDWYKLVPNENFSLPPGDSATINYRGVEAVIKETDKPMGLYFVYYNSEGEEEAIVEVSDYRIASFAREDQMTRNAEDKEPIPTPQWLFEENQQVRLLPPDSIKKIIPTPVSLQAGTGLLEVSRDYRIYHQTGLENEASYLRQALADVMGHQLKVEEGPGSGEHMIQLRLEKHPRHAEGYSLKVSREGVIITGSDAAGVFYGIQSLRSLIPLEAYRDKAETFSLPFIDVDDYPRFGFRGLHMDVSRNFQSKETILRILDLLSFYKVNRFLFYTTEDEGWRLEIDGLPELTTVGAQRRHTSGKETPVLHPAYGSGPFPDSENNYGTGHYSRADFVEILRYAKARHIKVIPELNFPGHARAAIKAMEARYERLMKEGQEEAANEYRLIDPDDRSEYLSAQAYTDNVVSVARESTFRFYEKVVDEIAKMYTEAGLAMDEIHAGGDEVPEGAWTQSPMAMALMAQHPEIKDPKNLQAYFFRELLKRLKKRNLRVDGWEEVALLKNDHGGYDPNPEFAGQNVVPFIWNNLFDNQDLGYRLANAGYPVVLCNVSNFYFDLAYSKDPREPGLYWAGFVNTRDAWLFAPFDMFKTTLTTSMGRKVDVDKEYAGKEKLKPEARKNILGLEAQLWSETIKGRDMIEYYMLPKLMGFAESAWAHERTWETVADPQRREQLYRQEWNVFANTLGQKELQRLSYLQRDGYNYRIAPPGAVIREGILHANSDFPGMIIRYTTDGTEPDVNSPVWLKPVKVSGHVILKAFDVSGRSSRSVTVSTAPER